MKSVEEMTLAEFKQEVQAESERVVDDMDTMRPAVINLDIVSQFVTLLVTLLAKERVWRKDLNRRLEVLEKKA